MPSGVTRRARTSTPGSERAVQRSGPQPVFCGLVGPRALVARAGFTILNVGEGDVGCSTAPHPNARKPTVAPIQNDACMGREDTMCIPLAAGGAHVYRAMPRCPRCTETASTEDCLDRAEAIPVSTRLLVNGPPSGRSRRLRFRAPEAMSSSHGVDVGVQLSHPPARRHSSIAAGGHVRTRCIRSSRP
jgi:hypothetical protein